MNPIMKAMAKVHTVVLQMSGGRMGNKMGGNTILLLHHVGAKSGKKYATPVAYVVDGDAYAIVAAAAGQSKHPGWYHNLQKHPTTMVEIRGNPTRVTAENRTPSKARHPLGRDQRRISAICQVSADDFAGDSHCVVASTKRLMGHGLISPETAHSRAKAAAYTHAVVD